MTINLKMRYKAETGNSPILNIESKLLTGAIEPYMFSEMNKIEIIHAIEYDYKHNTTWGVHINELPEEYKDNGDLKIYTPEYVRWLEEQLTNKTQ